MLKERAAYDVKIHGEKRSRERIKLSIPCRVDLLDIRDERRETPSAATCVDIAGRGMGLITDVQVYSGDRIEISIQGEGQDPVCIEGKVLWCKEGASNEFRAGIALNTEFTLDELLSPEPKG